MTDIAAKLRKRVTVTIMLCVGLFASRIQAQNECVDHCVALCDQFCYDHYGPNYECTNIKTSSAGGCTCYWETLECGS
jgi:hypothetical protein